jgi:FkbH-like protein
LNERGNAIFQNVLVSPTASYRGVGERSLPASTLSQTEMLTSELNARGESLVNWIDTDRLAGFVGRRQWSPDRLYHLGRLPFDMRFLPDYMRLFGGCWRAANGRSKKVLVVDLDNTLWGGVIGDDGLENIRLGPDTAEGEAFAFWGSYLKGLSRRGVTLAVSSKNDPDVARKAFAHPHLALSETDFAAFDCSWGDKAAGLRRISAELNVSLDSFVFADDNPAECDLIRRELPDVGVVELGDDPTAFVRLLEAEHWFDLPRYTREDFQRSDAYAGRRRALQARDGVTDMATYLSELEMFGEFREAGPNDIARIAQLEQKTNQFNVTTRRYDAARVSEFANSSDRTIAVFSLRDRYANHGLVSSLIAVREGHTLRIDSWLMSCRVFFRTAEQYILCRLVELARARGCNRIVGEYLPTEKNGVASSIYSKLGFTPLDDSGREWELDLRQATTPFVLECYVAEDPG